MILSFEIENYLSFATASAVEFVAGARVPDNYHFIQAGKDRVAKVVGVYGANASGKTNLLRALPALANFIADSFSYKLDDTLPFKPHMFADSKTIRMRIEFEVPGQKDGRYRYSLEATPNRVLSESLRVKTSKLFSRVFAREWVEGSYKVTGLGEKHAANLRENVSWLSWLGQYNVPEAVSIIQYFKLFRSNLVPRGPRIPSLFTTLEAINFYRDQPGYKSRMVDQLNRWDIDIDGVDIERVDTKEGDESSGHWAAYCVHKRGGSEARLSIFNESSGTMGMFSLLSIVLPVLDHGGVAVIDELEADLHPHMVSAVLNLFVMPDTNPKDAQLIFTSHADWLMNLLSKPQIVLVEKSEADSEAFQMSEFKGVAARENFSARYRSGAYGAVPEID